MDGDEERSSMGGVGAKPFASPLPAKTPGWRTALVRSASPKCHVQVLCVGVFICFLTPSKWKVSERKGGLCYWCRANCLSGMCWDLCACDCVYLCFYVWQSEKALEKGLRSVRKELCMFVFVCAFLRVCVCACVCVCGWMHTSFTRGAQISKVGQTVYIHRI